MTFATDVDGFEFETGRTIDSDGYYEHAPKEEAIVPGDIVSVMSEDRMGDYRVVEVEPGAILGYARPTVRQANSSSSTGWM